MDEDLSRSEASSDPTAQSDRALFSEDAEVGALGAMLADPGVAQILLAGLRPEHFYHKAHQYLFETIKELAAVNPVLDDTMLRAALDSKGLLNAVGGEAELCRLSEQRYNAANAERYMRIVIEFAGKRAKIAAVKRYLNDITEGNQEAEATSWDNLVYTRVSTRPDDLPSEMWDIRTLRAYDTRADPNNVLGNNWLKRGGSSLWVGNTGIGKSSLVMQAALTWALGESFFGIAPVRPLRSVIVQAENDIGDAAEQVQGVIAGMNLGGRVYQVGNQQIETAEDRIAANVSIFREATRTGRDFVDVVRNIGTSLKPDILFADPWLAYLGGDASDQEAVSRFLRNWLNPVLFETGMIFIAAHHTPKPVKDPIVSRNLGMGSNASYLGLGSVELPNWARSILTFCDIKDENIYELRETKRMGRSGLYSTLGKRFDIVWLRRSQQGICWFETEPPVSPEEEIAATQYEQQLAQVRQRVISAGALGATNVEMATWIQEACGVKGRQAMRLRELLMAAMFKERPALRMGQRDGRRMYYFPVERAARTTPPGDETDTAVEDGPQP